MWAYLAGCGVLLLLRRSFSGGGRVVERGFEGLKKGIPRLNAIALGGPGDQKERIGEDGGGGKG